MSDNDEKEPKEGPSFHLQPREPTCVLLNPLPPQQVYAADISWGNKQKGHYQPCYVLEMKENASTFKV